MLIQVGNNGFKPLKKLAVLNKLGKATVRLLFLTLHIEKYLFIHIAVRYGGEKGVQP